MKKLLPILLCTTAMAAAPAATPREAWSSFQQQLNAVCPGKHLDLLAPADLLQYVENYEPILSSGDMAVVDKYVYRACHNVSMGATCNNVGFLQAAIKLKRLDHFTAKLCLEPLVCTAQSQCKTP